MRKPELTFKYLTDIKNLYTMYTCNVDENDVEKHN